MTLRWLFRRVIHALRTPRSQSAIHRYFRRLSQPDYEIPVAPFRREEVQQICAMVDILKSPGGDKLSDITLRALILLLSEADDWLFETNGYLGFLDQ